MTMIKLSETDLKLAELVRRVEEGEEFIIEDGGKPVAVLREFKRDTILISPARGESLSEKPRELRTPEENAELKARRKRAFGLFKGQFPPVPDSVMFEPMSEEDLALWYGSEEFSCKS